MLRVQKLRVQRVQNAFGVQKVQNAARSSASGLNI
jgi:hypothetical protein